MSKRGEEIHSATREGGRAARKPPTLHQRVAVRVSYSANKNPGQWKAHGRYVARESATSGGRVAEAGFNGRGKNLGIAATLDNWQGAGDAPLFKIILSPGFAAPLNLQQQHRHWLNRMEPRPGHRPR